MNREAAVPDFSRGSMVFKALADVTRAKILHILSCGEKCACELLEYFDLSQPTLSHHLSILTEAGLVNARQEGKWVHYSCSQDTFNFLKSHIDLLFIESAACLCKKKRSLCT